MLGAAWWSALLIVLVLAWWRGSGPILFLTGVDGHLSLAQAQMLFWTMLLIVLFVTKSILDGAIWNVPWPLVGLRGFSQAGYLAPKLATQP